MHDVLRMHPYWQFYPFNPFYSFWFTFRHQKGLLGTLRPTLQNQNNMNYTEESEQLPGEFLLLFNAKTCMPPYAWQTNPQIGVNMVIFSR